MLREVHFYKEKLKNPEFANNKGFIKRLLKCYLDLVLLTIEVEGDIDKAKKMIGTCMKIIFSDEKSQNFKNEKFVCKSLDLRIKIIQRFSDIGCTIDTPIISQQNFREALSLTDKNEKIVKNCIFFQENGFWEESVIPDSFSDAFITI